MSIFSRIFSFITSLFRSLLSSIFALRYDSVSEPENISAKRRELVELVPRAAHLLEVGAGTGASLTANTYEGAAGRFSRLVLSEPDHGMRKRLKNKLRGSATGANAGDVQVVDAALPCLPWQDDEFDAVAVFFVLSHVDDREKGVKEIARVLKEGGKLVFMDHGLHKHGHHHHHHGHAQEHRNVQRNDDSDSQGTEQHAHRPRPWFMEVMRFWRKGHKGEDMDLDLLVDAIRKEEMLEEVFVGKMPCKDFFFDEVVYGCFQRKPEGIDS